MTRYGQNSKDAVMEKLRQLGFPVTYISASHGYWAQQAQDCDVRWETSTEVNGFTQSIRCYHNVSECAKKNLKVVPYPVDSGSSFLVELED